MGRIKVPSPINRRFESRTGMLIVLVLWAFLTSSLTLTSGCASRQRRPVPEYGVEVAQPPGYPLGRFWGDRLPDNLARRIVLLNEQITANDPETLTRPHHYLAISGGGANGAFGAGLLVGWTASGRRPEFQIVTGISTGALTAPFAFLGPEYDEVLRRAYTTLSTDKLMQRRSLWQVLSGDALSSAQPLRQTIAKYVTAGVMAQIAAEHNRGRRLFIGTTNLDAKRPVIWNIGAIAGSGRPDSLELIHDILLASASIPGVYPPVYIKVSLGGETYDEMHVDGGATSQVFLYPAALDIRQARQYVGHQGDTAIFVIRNGRLQPAWRAVEPKLLDIAARGVSSLIMTQGVGDIFRIYVGAVRDGVDYNLAFIPPEFREKSSEQFDPDYMTKLFDFALQRAAGGYPWFKAPPGLESIR